MFDSEQLKAIRIGLASSEKILSWSHGEVTKPETINYRSQKPEMDGLFCEKIFGPAKDYECHCGKYKKVKYEGVVCEKCGVEITKKDVRRERMGHIELASPCSHIWFLKGIPSRMGLVLDIPPKQLEDIIYYNAHIVLNVGESKVLRYKQYIDEKTGRVDFIPALEEVKEILKARGEESSYDYTVVEDHIAALKNERNQSFDYYGISNLICKYTGAKMGEGAGAIEQLLKEVDLEKESISIRKELKTAPDQRKQKLVKRLDVIDAFRTSGNKPEWMIIKVLPVIPPDLRPMLPLDGGRFATSDLNDLYRRVITRNNRLKDLIENNSPRVILTNEKRMLQEAVDALIDNGRRNGKPVTGAGQRPLKSLSGILKGKQGRFRQNLLGKRVDYSGRSVIAIGPDLKMYQCGLPREMAIKLLRPFIARELMENKTAPSHASADKMIDKQTKEVFDAVEKIISLHPVLLNRAPTLHRLGIQAFQPKLVDGRAIRLHPLVCTGFNADFDGDQMGVHVPLSKQAQEEAVHLMLASNNILSPRDGKPIVTPSQDIIIGNYYLTLEADKAYFEAKADKLEAEKDYQEASLYRSYALAEGKVFGSVDEVLLAYQEKKVHLHNRIAILGKALLKSGFSDEMNNSYLVTTVGKVIFNMIFPEDFPYLNEPGKNNLAGDELKFFVKKGTDIKSYISSLPLKSPFKKKDLSLIISEVFHKYGTSKTSVVIDKIKDQGFKYSTKSGVTVAISDIEVLKDKQKYIDVGDKKVASITKQFKKGLLTDEERHSLIIKEWTGIKDEIQEKVIKQLESNKRNPLFIMSDSGARGNKSNFSQLMGMRGLMGNTTGGTIELPVKSCFREGLNVSEFFTGTHGARKGGADTALKTADSGYLTRRLVDVSQDVIVREEDCHTDHGSVVKDIVETSTGKVIVHLYDRLVGRFSLNEIVNPTTGEVIVPANTLIDEEMAQKIIDAGIKEVEIRTIFGCETKDGVCVHCYGRNLATGEVVEVGQAVGIMAAQSIGEPGTQLTMRTFHTGGVAGSDITQGLPRVQELFEARNPKGQAIISEIKGKVTDIVSDKGLHKITVKNEETGESVSYDTTYGAKLRVSVGDVVDNGQKLTEGAISPKELLQAAGIKAVEKYIVKEIHKVYFAQEIDISDKHIEIIVKQMLRKVYISDAGDTNLLPGGRVSIQEFEAENAKAIENNLRPAVAAPLILGITKAALESDSWLSAASFQETTRILTDAAIKGKVDPLHGLKENVITGRLIPAGRGLLNEEQEDSLMENFDVEDSLESVEDQYRSNFEFQERENKEIMNQNK